MPPSHLSFTPRGVGESKRRWIRYQESDQFPSKFRGPVKGIKHTAVREDVVPSLHRTTALTFVSFGDVEPTIVFADRGMSKDRSAKASAARIILVDMM